MCIACYSKRIMLFCAALVCVLMCVKLQIQIHFGQFLFENKSENAFYRRIAFIKTMCPNIFVKVLNGSSQKHTDTKIQRCEKELNIFKIF